MTSAPVFYVAPISARWSSEDFAALSISPFHADLYHGWQRNAQEWRMGPEPLPEPAFAVNTWTPTLRIIGGQALVSPTMAEDLGACVKNLLLIRAIITLAFSHPVDASDGFDAQFLGISALPADLLDAYFVRRGPREDPPELIRAEPVVAALIADGYPDMAVLRVKSALEELDVDLELSRKMIYDHGMVWSSGLLCTPKVYEWMRPDVEGNPYFIVKRL